MTNLYVHYGCGLSAPAQWLNYDVSPTLRLQRIPWAGSVIRRRMAVRFPGNVLYGDIVQGLPLPDQSCAGVYCSHVLEHLALEDFRVALRNTYRLLRTGGVFRCVVPDLEASARQYLDGIARGDSEAGSRFMRETLLGQENRPKGGMAFLKSFMGNAKHLWMWDELSLSSELKQAGFKAIRRCAFNDSEDAMFKWVEDEDRFRDAVAIECRK